MITLDIDGPAHSDPQLEVGGYITLERADGRSIWRQRLRVSRIIPLRRGGTHYSLRPVDDTDGYLGEPITVDDDSTIVLDL